MRRERRGVVTYREPLVAMLGITFIAVGAVSVVTVFAGSWQGLFGIPLVGAGLFAIRLRTVLTGSALTYVHPFGSTTLSYSEIEDFAIQRDYLMFWITLKANRGHDWLELIATRVLSCSVTSGFADSGTKFRG